MSFENGTISFRMAELPRPFPPDYIEKFSYQAARPLEDIGTAESRGWVTSRHLLDSNITEESALMAGFVRLDLRQAERKVPATLLRAECRMEELAVMAAEGKAYLSAKARTEIRQATTERLLPMVPPTLKSIPFSYQPGATHLYVTALPVSQWDIFNCAMVSTLGFCGAPSTPEVLGESLTVTDLRDLPATSFSPEQSNEAMEYSPGRDFLTWLWFIAETQNGRLGMKDGSEMAVLVEGPLTFVHEGSGAHSAVLKKGVPESSSEAKTCLMSGKKLKEAKITFALDEQTMWHFGFEADEFLFRSMKLPKGEGQLDLTTRFQERMRFLEQFRELFLDVFGSFLKERTDAKRWSATVTEIKEWIESRPARS